MTVHLAPASVSLSKPSALNASALKQVFQTIDVDSCPHTYNFHLHTVYSDGQLQPGKLMEQAVSLGLQGLAITDHHSVKGYYQAHLWLESWKGDDPNSYAGLPQLWTGVEINANLLNTEVHILGYAFDPEHPDLNPYLQGKGTSGSEYYPAAKVIEAIHQAGGLAVLAHPCRYRYAADQLIPEAARFGIDGVETYYAYSNPNPWYPSPKQTLLVKELARGFGLFSTCGTDTHGLNLQLRI